MTRFLVALSCALLLSGCSTSSSTTQPVPSPSTPTAPLPTSTPTPDRETPEEFVRRWVETANQLARDGKADPLLASSHQCRDCMAIAEGVSRIYADGGWIHDGGWKVLDPVRRIAASQRGVTLQFVLAVAPSTYKLDADAPIQTTESERVRMQALIKLVAGVWKMREFLRLAQ